MKLSDLRQAIKGFNEDTPILVCVKGSINDIKNINVVRKNNILCLIFSSDHNENDN